MKYNQHLVASRNYQNTLYVKYLFSELKITQLNEKLSSAKKDFLNEATRNMTLKNTLKKIKIDLHNMTANFQDPTQLKLSVKVNLFTLN